MSRVLAISLMLAVVGAGSAQAQTGTVTGTVTRSAGATPVVGAAVYLCTASYSCGSGSTDAAGAYSITVAAGTYYLYTYNEQGLIDEIYDNIGCPGLCDLYTATQVGTAIVVTSGATLSGRNFALNQGGAISGTVTNAATSAPLASIFVYAYSQSASGSWVMSGSGYSDAAGAYLIKGLPSGPYILSTYNGAGFINEIFDNVQCIGNCSSANFSRGSWVTVTVPGTTTNRNFALEPGGSITGTITNSATSAPVSSVTVYVYRLEGGQAIYTIAGSTNAAGVYTIGSLPTGTYYLQTYNNAGLINETYDNVQCPGLCTTSGLATSGTPVAVTVGAVTANKNFALDPGGSITGTVRGSVSSAPIANVTIYVVMRTPSGGQSTSAYATTDATGAFTARGLPTGNYYLYTYNNQGYIDELFDNIPCVGGCAAATTGTAVAVTTGAVTSGKNFALDVGGRISGVVTNSITSAPIGGVGVYAYLREASGAARYVSYGVSSATGAFSVVGLPSGTYYLYTANSSGFVNRIFNGIQCLAYCSSGTAVTRGSPVTVTAGAETPGANFALDPGGRISGNVRSTASTAIANAYVYVYTRDSDGSNVYITSATTSASGDYSVTSLPAGRYYLLTDSTNHQNEIYDDIPCLGICSSGNAITGSSGVAVTVGGTASNINFVLAPAGQISGVVTRALTSGPLSGIWVYAYRAIGDGYLRYVGGRQTDSSGAFTIGGLPTGDYFLITWNSMGYENQGSGGVRCARQCQTDHILAQGTPIAVTAGSTTSGRNFALNDATGKIRGVLTNTATSAAANGVYVYAYTRTSTGYLYVGYGYSDTTGTYEINNLPPGTYFMHTNSYGKYVDEIYNDIPCLTACDYGVGSVTLGMPIAVTAATTTINFGLAPQPSALAPGLAYNFYHRVAGGTVVFTWSPPYDFGKATDYLLEVGLAPNTTAITIPVATTTYTATAVPPGRYYARVRARNASGVGPPTGEIEIVVNADGTGRPDAPSNLVVFVDGGQLQFSWAGPSTGGVATDYILEVGTSTGASNIGSLPVGAASRYSHPSVPPDGVYFFRVRARNALSISNASSEVRYVVGAAAAPPDPPGNIGWFVNAARQLTIGWLAPRGPITAYVIEAGTASGRSDLGAFPVPASVTSITVPVAPGIYYFRMRAVNAAGVGVASYSTTIWVP